MGPSARAFNLPIGDDDRARLISYSHRQAFLDHLLAAKLGLAGGVQAADRILRLSLQAAQLEARFFDGASGSGGRNCWKPRAAARSTSCESGGWIAGASRSRTCWRRCRNWNIWAPALSR
jgi:hypothetical protein